MKHSQELMVRANVMPKLRLAIKEGDGAPKPTGPHRVKIIEDKIQKGKDSQTGAPIDIVRYIVEEDGVQKRYDVPVKDKAGELHYLVQRLSELPEGQEIIMEMKKRGPKNYVSVVVVGHADEGEVGDTEIEDEPVIEII